MLGLARRAILPIEDSISIWREPNVRVRVQLWPELNVRVRRVFLAVEVIPTGIYFQKLQLLTEKKISDRFSVGIHLWTGC